VLQPKNGLGDRAAALIAAGPSSWSADEQAMRISITLSQIEV
jgi:hypothetical protein